MRRATSRVRRARPPGKRATPRDALRTGREQLPGANEAYRRSSATVRCHVEEASLIALVAALGVGYLLVHGRD